MSEPLMPAVEAGGAAAAKLARDDFQYVVLRVVPRVEREEFINAGVVVFCRTRGYLAACTTLDRERLRALDPSADYDAIRAQLRCYERIARGEPSAGPIARLSQSERFHWLAAPSSTVVQTSPGHTGVCEDPGAVLEHLFQQLVVPLTVSDDEEQL